MAADLICSSFVYENAQPALKFLRHVKTRHETAEYRWRCLSSRYNLGQSFVEWARRRANFREDLSALVLANRAGTILTISVNKAALAPFRPHPWRAVKRRALCAL